MAADDDIPRVSQRSPVDWKMTAVVCAGVVVTGAVLLYGVVLARESAKRMHSMNNMRQIALGAENYGLVHSHLPQQYPFGPENKGLSFRVALLPFVESNPTYSLIDKTLPWDAPKNQSHTTISYHYYIDPTNHDSAGYLTPYRMFVGPGAVVDGVSVPVEIDKIPDGASNTILYVAATEVVPWAKPEELSYGPGVPLPPLGGTLNSDAFVAAFADGSVKSIKKTITDADLRSLIETADGRTVVIP